jgi:ferritin
MLSEKMEKALNKQINEELFSSYLYLSMSAYFEKHNLAGFANWMKIQSEEEYMHARKIFDYTVEAGGKVELEAIKKPQTDWENIESIFQDTYDHEVFITQCINDLVTLAQEEKDHATNSFLQWFVDEQVEEVSTSEQILHEVKMIGDHNHGIFMLDREMKSRPPAITFSAE